jgi:uncharacterized protein YkwD
MAEKATTRIIDALLIEKPDKLSCDSGAGMRLKQGLVFAALSSALALAGCASDPETNEQPSFYRSLATSGATVDANAAASMITGYRRNNGLGAVVVDEDLMRAAMEQSRAMAQRDKLDHSVNRDFKDRLRRSGFDARIAVENIGAGYHTLAEAFSGWRDSPPHRANMLNKSVTQIGIAAVYAQGSKYKVFWTLILAEKDPV